MITTLNRRQVLATAVLAWLGLPALASADVEWCFDDPPVLVRLPSGAPVNVNVSIRVPGGRRDQLRAATASGTVHTDESTPTIQVTVLVPNAPDGSFPVQVTASAGKEQVQVTQDGVAGSPLLLALPFPTTDTARRCRFPSARPILRC